MQKEFHVKSEVIPTLGVSMYLFGLALGSLFLAPISETYGRKPVYIAGMLLFIWLHVTCYKSARAVEKRAAMDPALKELRQLAAGVQIALVAFAVGAMFHPIAYQFYFFVVGGLAVALKNTCRAEIAKAQPGPGATS